MRNGCLQHARVMSQNVCAIPWTYFDKLTSHQQQQNYIYNLKKKGKKKDHSQPMEVRRKLQMMINHSLRYAKLEKDQKTDNITCNSQLILSQKTKAKCNKEMLLIAWRSFCIQFLHVRVYWETEHTRLLKWSQSIRISHVILAYAEMQAAHAHGHRRFPPFLFSAAIMCNSFPLSLKWCGDREKG